MEERFKEKYECKTDHSRWGSHTWPQLTCDHNAEKKSKNGGKTSTNELSITYGILSHWS